jgi:glycosyltransferase involved in cell wall biosynthesis
VMASSDVLVLPTRWEGFGLVLAEALACGLPIVATHVGGVPEVLGDTGIPLIPPRNPDALRRAILEALDLSPADRETQAAHWRARATRYTGDRRATDLYDLIRDVVMAPSRHPRAIPMRAVPHGPGIGGTTPSC